MRWPSGSSERDIAVRPTDLLPRRLDGHAGDLLFDGFFDVGFQRSAHPPDHQANSSGVEGPTDRRNRRASSRRAGSGASVGGSTSHQDVVAPSHSILNEPVIEAILNSRKFTPRARSESARSGRIFRIRKARFAFSAAARTDAPRTGSGPSARRALPRVSRPRSAPPLLTLHDSTNGPEVPGLRGLRKDIPNSLSRGGRPAVSANA